jgi:ubiquinone/menaquinone biosynthesis C-methylase UbiE
MNDLSGFQHPRFARMWERMSARSDRRGSAGHRERTLAGLTGRVIEIGAGNGRNFSHYPETVTEVVAVEPEDLLRAMAERAAGTAPVPVRVIAGHADALPYEDASFDAAVVSLVLCSVPDPRRALSELRRILKPGGELRFFEHVRSATPVIGAFQDLIPPCGHGPAAAATSTGTPPPPSAARASTSKSRTGSATRRWPWPPGTPT